MLKKKFVDNATGDSRTQVGFCSDEQTKKNLSKKGEKEKIKLKKGQFEKEKKKFVPVHDEDDVCLSV